MSQISAPVPCSLASCSPSRTIRIRRALHSGESVTGSSCTRLRSMVVAAGQDGGQDLLVGGAQKHIWPGHGESVLLGGQACAVGSGSGGVIASSMTACLRTHSSAHYDQQSQLWAHRQQPIRMAHQRINIELQRQLTASEIRRRLCCHSSELGAWRRPAPEDYLHHRCGYR